MATTLQNMQETLTRISDLAGASMPADVGSDLRALADRLEQIADRLEPKPENPCNTCDSFKEPVGDLGYCTDVAQGSLWPHVSGERHTCERHKPIHVNVAATTKPPKLVAATPQRKDKDQGKQAS